MYLQEGNGRKSTSRSVSKISPSTHTAGPRQKTSEVNAVRAEIMLIAAVFLAKVEDTEAI